MKLATIFTPHMVLQREKPIRIFGQGCGSVTVELNGNIASKEFHGEKWELELPAMEAGGPYNMTVQLNGKTVVIDDVMIGDVWLLGGQSNMEHALRRVQHGLEDAQSCQNPNIRLFTVPRRVQPGRASTNWHFGLYENLDTPWEICNEESVKPFSAIGYHFARIIQAQTGVAVGMVSCNWGGSRIEPYIEESICRNHPALVPAVKYHENALAQLDGEQYIQRYEKYLENMRNFLTYTYEDSEQEVRDRGLEAAELHPYPDFPGEPYGKYSFYLPGILFKNMVARIMPYGLKGVLWYQGESNTDSSNPHRSVFRDAYDIKYAVLMRCWREAFKCPDLPFFAVELAPYRTAWDLSRDTVVDDRKFFTWAYIREMQMRATKFKNSYLITPQYSDSGLSIHPTDKRVAAERLANCALNKVYGKSDLPQSPAYQSAEFCDGKAYINVKGTKQLYVPGKNPYLWICGSDRNFVRASAKFENGKLVVWNDTIPEPKAVRYCYSDYFVGTIYSKEGLPLHPFRTDDYPLFD